MMKTLHRRCAGLDVHSDSVVACARLTVRTKVTHEVRRFSTTTRDLLELADWLAAQGITHITMEACLRLCPANPGNPRRNIEGESPLSGRTYGLMAATIVGTVAASVTDASAQWR